MKVGKIGEYRPYSSEEERKRMEDHIIKVEKPKYFLTMLHIQYYHVPQFSDRFGMSLVGVVSGTSGSVSLETVMWDTEPSDSEKETVRQYFIEKYHLDPQFV